MVQHFLGYMRLHVERVGRRIDEDDFIVWNDHRLAPTLAYCDGDFNADGIADASDFNIWNAARDAFFAAAASATAVAPVGMDQNDDGLISPVDALRIVNHINGAGGFQSRLDVNQDGVVSPLDALMVINYLEDQAIADAGRVEAANKPFLFFAEDEDEDEKRNVR